MPQIQTLSLQERFQNLETLRKAAWESVASRREFEWRISLSFWGLLVAFIAGIATSKISVAGHCAKCAVTLIPGILAYAHYKWLGGIKRAHDLDRMEEGGFREKMRKLIGDIEDPEITVLRRQIMNGKGWNKDAQVLATIALTILAVVAVWSTVPICFVH